MSDATPQWASRGCHVGTDADGCGEPIVGAHAVRTYPDARGMERDETPAHGVLLLCRRHFAALTAPPPED